MTAIEINSARNILIEEKKQIMIDIISIWDQLKEKNKRLQEIEIELDMYQADITIELEKTI